VKAHHAAPQLLGRAGVKAVARRLILPTLVAVLTSAACGGFRLNGSSKKEEQLVSALRTELARARAPYVTADREGTRLWAWTRRFYADRRFAPAWIERLAPRPQMDALIAAIEAADAEGLSPQIYGISALAAKRAEASRGFLTKKGFEPSEAGALDVWMTYVYMQYASDLADGLSDLSHADPAWKIQPEKFDPLAHLERALADNHIAESLLELTPQHPQYRQLRRALADYRELARRGGWGRVSPSLKVKPGQRHTGVGAVAVRLATSGDYSGTIAAEGEPMTLDRDLQEAVKRFERRHGLNEDGLLDPAVFAEMNVPVEQRIRQLELNLERWRWLPRDLGDRHIIVNIPAYQLDLWEGPTPVLSMRVVVGKEDSPTPIFDDRMTYVVFSPYWNVPPDIARDETLPSLMKDPAFLQRANMEVVDTNGSPVDPGSIDLSDPTRYRFRQRPGGSNSLGLVKFMFPNQYNVYLHDTPADTLFARASRSFSHGCVRIEKPEDLAEAVLRDQPDWTLDRIREAMHGDEEKIVKLKAPLPVYIGYWTAGVTPDGLVRFARDVYGIDARQAGLVAERLARLKKSLSRSPVAGDTRPR
jgi:L,D-transpeptidase YcbB